MDQQQEGPHYTIAIVEGQHGAEFDCAQLAVPVGSVTVWVNQTDRPQVIVPDTLETRRTMRLAPNGQDGAVWMMGIRSSRRQITAGETARWRLESNAAATITLITIPGPA
jgi:hypothetical protein